MIRDLSMSLNELLTKAIRAVPELANTQIAFDRPGDNFNPSALTLNVYLYDIRENTELRTSETPFQRYGNQASFQARAPLRVAASYLVTAWSGSTGENAVLLEQELLSQALLVLARNPRLPASCLKGQLIDQQPDLPMIAGQAEGLKNPSEFWTSLNNKLRPSITVIVTVSMPLADAITAPLVTSSEIVLKSGSARRSDPIFADFYEIAGLVVDGNQAVLAGAAISLKDSGLNATSDTDGRYRLGKLAKGKYTLLAECAGKSKEFEVQVPPIDEDPTKGENAYNLILM